LGRQGSTSIEQRSEQNKFGFIEISVRGKKIKAKKNLEY
jgi:hypothetical protein